MGIMDRFRGNRFELPEEQAEQSVKNVEQNQVIESPQLTVEMRSFAEVREFSEPLLAEEEKELEKAVDDEPQGFLIDLKKKMGKYRAFLEMSRFMLGAMSSCGADSGRNAEEEMAATGGVVYEQMATVEIEPENEGSAEKRHEELASNLEKAPNMVLDSYDTWKDEPFADDLIKEAVKTAPDTVVWHLTDLQGTEHFQTAIDGLVDGQSRVLASFINQSPEHRLLVQPALEAGGSEYAADLLRITDGGLRNGEAADAMTILPLIHERELTVDQIKELIGDEHKFVDARLEGYSLADDNGRHGIEVSLSTEFSQRLQEINERKGHSDRFKDVEASSPEELYAMMALEGDEARESTAKGVLKEMMVKMIKEDISAKELVDSVDGMHFREFVSTASGNESLKDFLGRAETPAERQELISQFVGELAENPTTDEISAVAQTILREGDSRVGQEIKAGIAREYTEAVGAQDERGITVYGHLSGLYGAESAAWLEGGVEDFELKAEETLPLKELLNEDGENVQIYHFYGDHDGKFSFEHFIEEYEGKEGWTVTDHDTFVEVKKTEEGRSVRILANKPEFASNGDDDWRKTTDGRSGVDDIHSALSGEGKAAQIEVHRGHAYWAGDTVDSLSPSTKLYFDGGCTGGTRVEDALAKVPDAQLVFTATKGTGMASINDAMLSSIQESILSGQDINWEGIHEEVAEKVAKNADATQELSYYRLPHMQESAGYVVSVAIESELNKPELAVN